METLTSNILEATALDPAIATAAIGHVLLFLKSEAPQSRVAEFIDETPKAREAVEAALASSDAGVTQVIEGMTSFMGRGRADTNILVGKLQLLGLNEKQIKDLVTQVVSRADALVGAEGATRIREVLLALDERLGPTGEQEQEQEQENEPPSSVPQEGEQVARP